MSKVPELHKEKSPTSVGIYIVTCSTSRFNQLRAKQQPDDESGDSIERLLTSAGHRVAGRRLIPDIKPMIRKTATRALSQSNVDAVIVTGGTGLSLTDVTFEAISPMLDREIPGFGEIFRRISFDEIGSAAIMSRAFAGTVKGKVVFCLPGSPNAVRTAMERLIIPELGHLVGLSRSH